jgi:quercetin dioxygenase-like cupin family protein
MSSSNPSPFPTSLPALGDIKGTRYDFYHAGDILPKHTHDELSAHITIVATGKIKAYSHDWETVVPAGGLIDFRVGEPHEIMALEDNTRIFNILKNSNGIPTDSLPGQPQP